MEILVPRAMRKLSRAPGLDRAPATFNAMSPKEGVEAYPE